MPGLVINTVKSIQQSFLDIYFFLQSHVEMAVTSLTVHRLVITAVMLAAKLMDDKYYSNAFYAKIGGVSTSDLNHMELEMLRMLDYRTFVSSSRLHELLGRLEVFQAPGRIVSVLCRKRSSYAPNSSSAAPAPPVGSSHKSKLAKSNIADQSEQQLSGELGRVPAQTISDQQCDSVQKVASDVSKIRCSASANCCVVYRELPQPFEPPGVVVM